jgi:hypothetical protein
MPAKTCWAMVYSRELADRLLDRSYVAEKIDAWPIRAFSRCRRWIGGHAGLLSVRRDSRDIEATDCRSTPRRRVKNWQNTSGMCRIKWKSLPSIHCGLRFQKVILR